MTRHPDRLAAASVVAVAVAVLIGLLAPAQAQARATSAPASQAAALLAADVEPLSNEPARAPSPPYEVAWDRALGDDDYWRPVVGAEATFLVGTRPYPSNPDVANAEVITGLDAETGQVRWQRRFSKLRWTQPYRNAVHGDTVVIPSTDDEELGRGRLFAVDGSSGRLLWEVATDVDKHVVPVIDEAGTTVVVSTVATIVSPGNVLVEDQMWVRAFDLATGRLRWEVLGYRDDRTWLDASLPVSVGEGTLVVGSPKNMAAYDLFTGALRWRTEDDPYDRDVRQSGYVVGRIADGTLLADFRGGALVYDLATGRALRPAPTGWAMDGPMAFAHRHRYGSGSGSHLIDMRTGRTQWTTGGYNGPDATFDEITISHGSRGELVIGDLRDGRTLWTAPNGWEPSATWARSGDTLLRSEAEDLLALRTVLGAVDRVEPRVTTVDTSTPVVLTGAGFTGATAVEVGDQVVHTIDVRSDGELAVVAPPLPAGEHDVRVVDKDGEPLPLGGRARLQVVDRPPAPIITPSVGRPTGGTTVTIEVSDADLVEAVQFGLLPAPIIARTPHNVEVQAPAGIGDVGVRVRTLAGWSPTAPFSYAGTPLPVSPAATHRIDATHDNVQDESLQLPLSERWRVDLDGVAAGSPVIAEGKVFIVEGGRIRAIDAGTGRTAWGPIAINAGTVSYGEGRLYVTSRLRVVALDAETGTTLWVDDADVAMHADIAWDHAPTTYADGRVLVGADERTLALDATTGDLAWADEERRDGHAPPSVVGDLVVTPSSGALDAFDLRTGAPVWRQWSQAVRGGYKAPVAIAAGVVHESGSYSPPSSMRDPATGEVLGTHPLESESSSIYRGDLAVYGRRGQYDHGLSAFQPSTGTPLWTLATRPTAELTADQHHAYQLDDKGILRAVDLTTGAVDWIEDPGIDPWNGSDVRHGYEPYDGPAVGDGLLVIQVGDVLIAYGSGPQVDEVAPRASLPGDAVTITGSGFDGATAVTFGGLPATSFEVVDDETISAVPPLGIVRAVDVRVTSSAGTSAVVVGDRYGLIGSGPGLVPPVLADVLAPTLVLGGVAANVTINGSGFVDGATVIAPGLVFLDVDVVSTQRITARAVAPLGIAAGLRSLTVLNPDGAAATLEGVLQVIDASSPPTTDPPPPPDGTPTVDRLAGADRLATAIAVSHDRWASAGADGRQAHAVVLARSDSFADALTGAPLAAHLDGPILLTPTNGLDPRVLAEVARLLPSGGAVHVLGGTASISPAVVDALDQAGFVVTRHAGATRYETAVAVAEAIGDPTVLLVVTGRTFPDGLAAGAAASHLGGAVLLTDGPELPSATSTYLDAHPSVPVRAIGGPAAAALPTARRIVGADRYATALLVAQQLFPATVPTAGLASGAVFPDALVAGAHVGRDGGPLLLSSPTSLPAGVAAYLSDAVTGRVILYGGPSALAVRLPGL